MTKNVKRFMIASVIACSTMQTVPASACGGRGGSGNRGGISIGFGGGGMQAVLHSSVPARPVYHPVVVSQPTYAPHTYAQPAYSQPHDSQPIQASSINLTIPQSQQVPTQQVPTQQVSTQQVSTTAVPTAVGASPTVSETPAQTSSVANQPIPSALQMLASLALEPALEADTASDAVSIPEFTTAKPAMTNANIGTWKVSLPGNQSVELNLNEIGQFTWTATKSGAASTFTGTYQLENGQLTLVRANDNQQMRGTWTPSENGFTFKLDGATTGGLTFAR